MPKLTARQSRFVDLYVVDGNGARAAEMAGFSASSAKQIASKLLTNVDVRAAIEDRRRALVEGAGVTAEMVVEELRRIGFADVRKLIKWRSGVERLVPDEETGDLTKQVVNEVTLVDSDKIDDATAAAISSISQSAKGELKIRFHSKEAALVNLGKHLGLFREQDAGANAPVVVNIIDPRSSAKAKK